jgi:hypothetical protein
MPPRTPRTRRGGSGAGSPADDDSGPTVTTVPGLRPAGCTPGARPPVRQPVGGPASGIGDAGPGRRLMSVPPSPVCRWRAIPPPLASGPVGPRPAGRQPERSDPPGSPGWERSSSRVRRWRVVCCLASSTQQMNSLRARGVMSFQAARAGRLEISDRRRSGGSSCTTPPGTAALLTGPTVATMCRHQAERDCSR